MASPIPTAALSGGHGSHQASCSWACYNATTGVSSGAFRYGNTSHNVGDDPFAVDWNRERILEAMGGTVLLSATQVHGDNIYVCREIPLENTQVDAYDGLITDQRGLCLMIQQADCQAILLFDEKTGAIGALHAGWRGNVINAIGTIISAMAENFGTNPQDIKAIISPSLGPCCAEFVNYKSEFPEHFWQFMTEKENHFDLWAIARFQLTEAGVPPKNIETAGICTSCNPDFFSHRRACREANGKTGRNCSCIIAL